MAEDGKNNSIALELVITSSSPESNRAIKYSLELPAPMTVAELQLWLSSQTNEELLLLAGAFPQAAGFALFGKTIPATTQLKQHDRLELLCPLLADPKLARRQRVQASRSERASQGQFDRWTRNR